MIETKGITLFVSFFNEKIIQMELEIENTKIIHSAKEIIMEKYSFTENDAYKKLRKL
ncbi:MAG: ANTAR domain-containing protein, partial [Mucilaginibacter sp.]